MIPQLDGFRDRRLSSPHPRGYPSEIEVTAGSVPSGACLLGGDGHPHPVSSHPCVRVSPSLLIRTPPQRPHCHRIPSSTTLWTEQSHSGDPGRELSRTCIGHNLAQSGDCKTLVGTCCASSPSFFRVPKPDPSSGSSDPRPQVSGQISPPVGGASACHWPPRPLVSQQVTHTRSWPAVSVAWKRVQDTFTDKVSTSETRNKVSQTEWNVKARRCPPQPGVAHSPRPPGPGSGKALLAGAQARGGEDSGETPTPVRHIFSGIKILPVSGSTFTWWVAA